MFFIFAPEDMPDPKRSKPVLKLLHIWLNIAPINAFPFFGFKNLYP